MAALAGAFCLLGGASAWAKDPIQKGDPALLAQMDREAQVAVRGLWELSQKTPSLAAESLAHALVNRYFAPYWSQSIEVAQIAHDVFTAYTDQIVAPDAREAFQKRLAVSHVSYCLSPGRVGTPEACLKQLNSRELTSLQSALISLWDELTDILTHQDQTERAAVIKGLMDALLEQKLAPRALTRFERIFLSSKRATQRSEDLDRRVSVLAQAIQVFEKQKVDLGVASLAQALLLSEYPILFASHQAPGVSFADEATRELMPPSPYSGLPLTPALAELLLDPRPVLTTPLTIYLRAQLRPSGSELFKQHLGRLVGQLTRGDAEASITAEFASSAENARAAMVSQHTQSAVSQALDRAVRQVVKPVARAVKHSDCAVILQAASDGEGSEAATDGSLSAKDLPQALVLPTDYLPLGKLTPLGKVDK